MFQVMLDKHQGAPSRNMILIQDQLAQGQAMKPFFIGFTRNLLLYFVLGY